MTTPAMHRTISALVSAGWVYDSMACTCVLMSKPNPGGPPAPVVYVCSDGCIEGDADDVEVAMEDVFNAKIDRPKQPWKG